MNERPRIVLDCDPGLDDAIAILCAHRYADLVAITTVNGNVGIEATTRNALCVTTVAAIDVPVHRGAAHPLAGPAHVRDAVHVHGPSGLGDVELPDPPRGTASDDAIGFLLEAADPQFDLVAVGPLTNVAIAQERDGRFLARWRSVTIMGGSLSRGNSTDGAEFNMWADPEAAGVVLHAAAALGTTPTFIPLDLTRQVRSDAALVERLTVAATPTSALASGLLRHAGTIRGVDGATALHDPCAVLSLTHREWFTFRALRLAIDLHEPRRGCLRLVDGPANANVGLAAERDEVIRLVEDACIDPFRPTR